ncbi:GNAT family N-acetyltransferase [Flavobacterium sp.]|uniref:GNAT family N-acetyltransferase n=1 Tax=Flavobacterium sp. TaxID=239 RepID=UPI00260EE45B|nr:GNAT family N-acetyltransferase [Flavobacterium sp.]
MMKPIIETKRLRLREFTLEDTQFIMALLNSPGWIEFIGERNVKTKQDAVNYLQNGPMKIYENHGFGLWMVELKDGKTPVGMCGILKRDTLEFPDIGFCFLPEFSGKGYAYESAMATMTVAQETYNVDNLCAITLAHNSPSIKLLEKLGFRFVSPIQFPDDGEVLMLYQN